MKDSREQTLAAKLQDQANLPVPQDRLQAVLIQTAQAHKPARRRLAITLWLSGLAASLAAGIAILLAVNTERETHRQQADLAVADSVIQDGALATTAEDIARLMADSKALENSLQRMGARRARISQMSSLNQASAQLAHLDSQLEYWASAEPNNLAQHRALWRERVTVMHAVEKGEFHPALFLVD